MNSSNVIDREKNKVNVSVIVTTYNSDIQKLYRTLFSTIRQKGLALEIIVTDDGTKDFDLEIIHQFFKKNGFEQYTLIGNKENQGTVNNFKRALAETAGEYIFGISPGDYFYSDSALLKLYDYAKTYKLSCVFGNPMYYSCDGTVETRFYRRFSPMFPQLFNFNGFNNLGAKLSVLYNNNPVGATFLREREMFIQYINMISNKVKYLEDKSISSLYLFDGGTIRYLNAPIIWYEYGSGISNGNKSMWKLLEKDNRKLREILLNRYPNNYLVKSISDKSKIAFFKHPIAVTWKWIMILCSVACQKLFRYQKNALKNDLYYLLEIEF